MSLENRLADLQAAIEDHDRYACECQSFDPDGCTWCRVVYEAARVDGAIRSHPEVPADG